MSKTKVIFTLVLILGLAALSFYMNKDSFEKKPIQISHRMSPWMRQVKPATRRKASDLGAPVTFTLNDSHKLTAIKVVLIADMETNKFRLSAYRDNRLQRTSPSRLHGQH